MLKQDLLFERSSIFGLNVRETGRNCTFISLEVIIPHLQFTKLDLHSLIFLAERVEFTLKRSRGRIVIGLKRHELRLPRIAFALCPFHFYLEFLLRLLGPLEFPLQFLLEFFT